MIKVVYFQSTRVLYNDKWVTLLGREDVQT